MAGPFKKSRAWSFVRGLVPAESLAKEYAAAELVAEQGLTPAAAAERVGLPDGAAVKRAMQIPQIAGLLNKALDDAGATIDKSARCISEAMDAERVTHHTYKGEVISDSIDVDHQIRLQAAELNLRARGVMKDSGDVNLFMDLDDSALARIANGELDPAKIIDLGPRLEDG